MFVYTIQPAVKPVVKLVVEPVWQPVVSCIQTLNRLSNPFDSRFNKRLYRVYSRLSNRLYNPVWQLVERTVAVLSTRLSNRVCQTGLTNTVWLLFSISYSWGATRQNVSKLAAFRSGRSLGAKISGGKGSFPCQHIDTTRKAIDCATSLPLSVFIQWNFAADFSSCIVEIVQKTKNLGTLSPFWGS